MPATVRHRNNCRLCERNNVELVVKLEPIPLAEKYSLSSDTAKSAELFPIDLYMCRDCGHVQLLDVIDSETLWDDYTYHSGQTKGIVDHFQEIADKIVQRYKPKSSGLIVDIGSNDGSFLRQFKERGYRVAGVDPAREIATKATDSGIPTIAALMSTDVTNEIITKYGSASVVTAFNVFAHADDLSGMAENIRMLLAPDGVFVFECQYLVDIIDKFLLGTIFHEHMSHHSLKPMVKFLASHGMELIDVERNSIQKGSIVGTAQLVGGPHKKTSAVDELLALEASKQIESAETIKSLSVRINKIHKQFSEVVEQCRRDKKVLAGFGAARSGPTLLAQFGIGPHVEYIFDDHPQKTGKYSPGDGIKVLPTSELNVLKPDYVVILAWIHAKKIIESNQEYLKKGGKFIVCCPDFEVVDARAIEQRDACSVAR